jgi:hypothetical protein
VSRKLTSGLLVAFLLLCLLLGGASAAGLWLNVLLQLLATLMIFAAVAFGRTPLTRAGKRLLLLLLLLAAIILVQLAPLPPAKAGSPGPWCS